MKKHDVHIFAVVRVLSDSECPVCKSADITGGPVEIENGKALQKCSCDECDAEWTAVYSLSEIRRGEG